MLSVVLPIPVVAFMLTTDSLAAFYWVNPLAHMLASAWVGAAVATLQDLVLPRMRATAGATYILGTTMVGLALGPYFAGKMSVVTGGLATGIAALYFMPLLTLIGLWIGVAPHRPARGDQGRARPRRRRADLRGRENAAGDPRAAIAARVGPVIVGRGVDHDRRAVGVEQRRVAAEQRRARRCAKSSLPRRPRRRRDWAGRRDDGPAG